ncbi:MAG: tyrosine-type recombinase/integrase [Jatrophihabitans sp.]
MRAGGRPETTIDLRRLQLARLARDLSTVTPWEVTPAVLVSWLASRSWRAETRRSFRTTIRGFYRWAVLTGRCEADPTITLPGVPASIGVPRPAPDERIRFALAGSGSRLRLMILLAAVCGLRRCEIAKVHTDDISAGALRVRGKGDRVRVVPLPPIVAQAIAGRPAGWLFPRPTQPDTPMTPAHVGKLMSAQLGPGVTAHMLRHRFASTAYAAERDLRAVQTLLGHTKPETTALYTAVPEGALSTAVRAAAVL